MAADGPDIDLQRRQAAQPGQTGLYAGDGGCDALVGKNRQQIEADSAAQQLKLAQLQTEVASLKQQKIQVDSAQLYRDNLPKWQALLAHAKAHPSAPWMYGIPMGALIEPLTRSIALAQTDPAKLQTLIEKDELQIGATQTSLSSLLGLVSDFKALDTLTSRTLAGANPALANSFNANRTRNQIEAMNVFSETAMRVVGDMYQHLYDAVTAAQFAVKNAQASANPTDLKTAEAGLKAAQAALDAKEGERALAHGLVGGLTAALGNVDPASGFLGGAAGKLATLELGKLIDGTDWARANPQAANALKTLTATATGTIVGGASGGLIASQGDRFNRQLHQNEAQWLSAKRKAVGAEQGARYDAAACFLLMCAQGVPTSDANYATLVKMQTAGGTYTAELNELRGLQAKELFTYSGMDVVGDFLLRHDEALSRSGGVLKVVAGRLGMASGAGIATGSALGCGPSAGVSCLLVPVGAGLLVLSYEEAKAGTVQATGRYGSTEGARVLASFNAESYPGERDRIKELGLDVATAAVLMGSAKLGAGAVEKLGAKLEKWWADRAVKEVKGANGGVVADEAAALGRIGGNANGPVLNGKAPNTVLNQQAVNDLANGLLPGITKNPVTGLPDAVPRTGVPREMPGSLNPSATAEDFANRLFGGTSTPANAKPILNCNGCWSATNADGVSVTYRPASTASVDTSASTASVDINFKLTGNAINGGKPMKLKFPQQGG